MKTPNIFDKEIFGKHIDQTVILIPKETAWQTFLDGLNGFTNDLFENDREAEIPIKRDSL